MLAIYSITDGGSVLAQKLWQLLGGDEKKATLFLKANPLREVVSNNFHHYRTHLFVASIGVVVRVIAPLIQDKKSDPAVLCLDERGEFVIPILCGHLGGANEFACKLAALLGNNTKAVLTTASDVLGELKVDLIGKRMGGWPLVEDASARGELTKVSADVANAEAILLYQDAGKNILENPEICHELFGNSERRISSKIIISDQEHKVVGRAIYYRPPTLVLGLGMDRDFPIAALEDYITATMMRYKLALKSLTAIATIVEKREEKAITSFVEKYQLRLLIYSKEELKSVANIPNPSAVVEKYLGTPSVAEAAAILAGHPGKLIVSKQKYCDPLSKRNMTLAIARRSE
ncbi:MAG: cobalamin biosynthesis protein [Oligoflexia bacterium]|nr:cobalamin biosynthesis protein [Oligoflexia bacterium]MBF0365918.1 cobalamin biosynthesis protein [Oligoflexia bacterium]